MNKIAKLFVAATAILGGGSAAHAQALHVLIACDTNDPSIGAGVVSNMENLSKLAQEAFGVLQCEGCYTVFPAPECTKENVTRWIKELESGPDDTILFMYSGHGGRALNDDDRFPQMCMNNPSNQAGFLPVSHVAKMLQAKNPRLSIVITECCNSEASWVQRKPYYAMASGDYTSAGDYDAKALRDLFFNPRGSIVITSSKPKEYSFICVRGDGIGGIFVNEFIDAYQDATKNHALEADWNKIFDKVHDNLYAMEFNLEGRTHRQEPMAEIALIKPGTDRQVDKKRDFSTSGSLFESLQYLVNPATDVQVRLSKIPEIFNRHFTSGAKVFNIAADGRTIVDREDAEDFLRRITLSRNIRQISVINGSDTERNSVIKVHELRK